MSGTTLRVKPAIPFDSFTLTLGATQLLSSERYCKFESWRMDSREYRWSRNNKPELGRWADPVDVELHVPLIDICGRSQAVADAIVAATHFLRLLPHDLAAGHG